MGTPVIVGTFGSFPVSYYPLEDAVMCKEQGCPLNSILEAMRSDVDRVVIKNSTNNLLLNKTVEGKVTIGCLSDTTETFKSLYKEIKKVKKQFKQYS